MSSASPTQGTFPKAVLYSFGGSVWASVPRLCFLEKGFSASDFEERTVNLLEAENFSPNYLRVNSNGSVPTLVVPLAETTGQEVDTKFRALVDSIEIADFIDSSRSQQLLEAKGVSDAKPAPVLAPAHIEGKAASDALIKMVHSAKCDPNAALLSARTQAELESQRKALQGQFCRVRQDALEKHRAEAKANATSTGENPRTAAMTEKLVKWYDDKIAELAPVHNAYLTSDAASAKSFIEASHVVWAGIADALMLLEGSVRLPYALGDQVSLADLHVGAWLARILAVAKAVEPSAQDELAALNKALQHPNLQDSASAAKGVGEKVSTYWTSLKQRESFKKVYADGPH